MAPKPSQGPKPTSQLSSLDGTLSRAVEKFGDEVAREKKFNVPIKALGALNELRESLRAYRKSDAKISTFNTSKLVDILDNYGSSISDQLEPPIFSVLIGAMLQGSGCRDAQHGLYLLAMSLYEGTCSSDNRRVLRKRQDLIGVESLLPLLNYFVDGSMPVSMRRWVIILGHQLLLGSEENRAKLELGSDSLRQKIGPLMVDETNDHIRVLCGQLVRDLVTSGIPLESLFPTDYNKKMYEGFPGSTQGNKGWSALFENWVSDIYIEMGQLQNSIDLHFGAGFSILPSRAFGNVERNVYVLVVEDELSILALVSDKNMEHILDIPLQSINHMTVDYQAHSQNQGYANMMLEIKPNRNMPCYLNTIPSKVDSIHMSVEVSSIERLKALFSQICPGFKVTDGAESYDHAQPSTVGYENDKEEPQATQTRSNTADKSSQIKVGRLSVSQSQYPIQVDREGMQRCPLTSEAYPELISSGMEQENELPNLSHLPNHEKHKITNKDIAIEGSHQVKDSACSISQVREQKNAKKATPQKKKQIVRSKAKKPIIGSRKKEIPGNVHIGNEKIAPVTFLFANTTKPATISTSAKNNSKSNPLVQPSNRTSNPSNNSSQSTQTMKRSRLSTLKASNGLPSKREPEKYKQDCTSLVESDNELDTTDLRYHDVSKPKSKPGIPSIDSAVDTNPRPKKMGGVPITLSADSAAKIPKRGILSQKDDDMGKLYDMPSNNNDKDTQIVKKLKISGKATIKSRKSTGAVPKKTSNGRKAATKKRQSAPALLQNHSTRTFQRAAAVKANTQLKRVDISDAENDDQDELNMPKEDPKHSKKEAVPSINIKTSQDTSRKIASQNSKTRAARAFKIFGEDDAFAMDQEDAAELEFINEKAIVSVSFDKAYENETESRRVNQSMIEALAIQQADADADAKTQIAIVEMASKLENLLELEDNEDVGTIKPSVLGCEKSEKKISVQVLDNDIVVTPDKVPLGHSACLQGVYAKNSAQQIHSTIVQDTSDNFQMKTLMTPTATRKSKIEDFHNPTKRRSFQTDDSCQRSSKRRSPEFQVRSKQRSTQDDSEIVSNMEAIQGKVAKITEPGSAYDKLSTPTLIDDHLARKQQLISFDEHGPRNQGLSSRKLMSDSSIDRMIATESQIPTGNQTPDLKRKRCETKVMEVSTSNVCPLIKRPSKSPLPTSSGAVENEDDPPVFSSSPPSQPNRSSAIFPLTKRTSSRASRVDTNGSPVASPSISKIDHIDKLRKKLFDDLHDQHMFAEVGSNTKINRPRSLSQIFGPKLILGGQPKARPSSPEELVERYIAHKKTGRGAYEEVETKYLVEVQKVLADPFDAKGRKTAFTERLKLRANPTHSNTKRQSTEKYRQEKLSVSDDLTSCSTDRSSEAPKTPLEGKMAPNDIWNMALRPHYTVLADAVHRVADEVIVQLAGEEDKMSLLAKDYEVKGSKLVQTFEHTRKQQQASVVENLEQKKIQILGLYKNSKLFVQNTKEECAGLPVSAFEKYWRKQQSLIQDKVSAGMRRKD